MVAERQIYETPNAALKLRMPNAPENVPDIAQYEYFEIIGILKTLGKDDQEFEKVKYNMWYFTDYIFFWTPRKYIIMHKDKI